MSHAIVSHITSQIEHEWFAKHIDVNYMGHVNAVLAALPYMKAQGSGR